MTPSVNHTCRPYKYAQSPWRCLAALAALAVIASSACAPTTSRTNGGADAGGVFKPVAPQLLHGVRRFIIVPSIGVPQMAARQQWFLDTPKGPQKTEADIVTTGNESAVNEPVLVDLAEVVRAALEQHPPLESIDGKKLLIATGKAIARIRSPWENIILFKTHSMDVSGFSPITVGESWLFKDAKLATEKKLEFPPVLPGNEVFTYRSALNAQAAVILWTPGVTVTGADTTLIAGAAVYHLNDGALAATAEFTEHPSSVAELGAAYEAIANRLAAGLLELTGAAPE